MPFVVETGKALAVICLISVDFEEAQTTSRKAAYLKLGKTEPSVNSCGSEYCKHCIKDASFAIFHAL